MTAYFTFDDSATDLPDGSAYLRYHPSTILNPSCQNVATGAGSCEGFWWTLDDQWEQIHDTYGPSTSFTFTFLGDSVTMYGLFGDAAAAGMFNIDGGQNSSFSQLNASQPLPWTSGPCFTVRNLDPTIHHNLSVYYDDAHYTGLASNRTWLSLDYFVYTRPTNAGPTIGNLTTTPTSTSGGTVSTTFQSHPSSSHHPSSDTGAIVGGVVGGVLALLAMTGALIAYFFYRKRAARRRTERPDLLGGPGPMMMEPWQPPASSASGEGLTKLPSSSSPTNQATPLMSWQPSSHPPHSHSHSQTPSQTYSPSEGGSSSGQPSRVGSPPVPPYTPPLPGFVGAPTTTTASPSNRPPVTTTTTSSPQTAFRNSSRTSLEYGGWNLIPPLDAPPQKIPPLPPGARPLPSPPARMPPSKTP